MPAMTWNWSPSETTRSRSINATAGSILICVDSSRPKTATLSTLSLSSSKACNTSANPKAASGAAQTDFACTKVKAWPRARAFTHRSAPAKPKRAQASNKCVAGSPAFISLTDEWKSRNKPRSSRSPPAKSAAAQASILDPSRADQATSLEVCKTQTAFWTRDRVAWAFALPVNSSGAACMTQEQP